MLHWRWSVRLGPGTCSSSADHQGSTPAVEPQVAPAGTDGPERPASFRALSRPLKGTEPRGFKGHGQSGTGSSSVPVLMRTVGSFIVKSTWIVNRCTPELRWFCRSVCHQHSCGNILDVFHHLSDWEHKYVEQQWPQDGALRNSTYYFGSLRFIVTYRHKVVKRNGYPVPCTCRRVGPGGAQSGTGSKTKTEN